MVEVGGDLWSSSGPTPLLKQGHLEPRTMSRCMSWTFRSYAAKRRMNSSEPVRKGMVIRQSRYAEYVGYRKSTSGIHLKWTFPHPHNSDYSVSTLHWSHLCAWTQYRPSVTNRAQWGAGTKLQICSCRHPWVLKTVFTIFFLLLWTRLLLGRGLLLSPIPDRCVYYL